MGDLVTADRKPTWEDIQAAADKVAGAGLHLLYVTKQVTDNPALIAAAERAREQADAAAAAGRAIGSLIHRSERLADFESGAVTRNPGAT